MNRREVLAAGAGLAIAPYVRSGEHRVLGQGDWQYEVVPGWGVLGADTPVKNCSAMVCTQDKHLVLLTDHPKNNVIVYDVDGKLVDKWGTQFPGAHGLSLVTENGQERLFITDLKTNRVCKTTLSGEILATWTLPTEAKAYTSRNQYKPSWTLHRPDGSFVVLDGYGKDYFFDYDAAGALTRIFGGPEGGIAHWGPHGGTMDTHKGENTLLIAMSDQQYLLRLHEDGSEIARVPLPGGNPRQIRPISQYRVVPHLADNWPKNRNSRGFLSILDANHRVLANIGGTAPDYDDNGHLQHMKSDGTTFLHPHDVVADADTNLYVPQYASKNTYPVKLARI